MILRLIELSNCFSLVSSILCARIFSASLAIGSGDNGFFNAASHINFRIFGSIIVPTTVAAYGFNINGHPILTAQYLLSRWFLR